LREVGYTTAVAGPVDFPQLPFDRKLLGESRGPAGDAETAELACGFLREQREAPFFLSVGL
jgi:hypothetical protein